ncbi:unnamed protein product, partial [Ectocarpus sp. 13 AM-2016]
MFSNRLAIEFRSSLASDYCDVAVRSFDPCSFLGSWFLFCYRCFPRVCSGLMWRHESVSTASDAITQGDFDCMCMTLKVKVSLGEKSLFVFVDPIIPTIPLNSSSRFLLYFLSVQAGSQR